MKKLLLICGVVVLLGGCSDIVLRKDLHERVAFSSEIKEGDYNLYFYKLNYPDNQQDKLDYLNNFKEFLNKNPHKNYIVPVEMGKDILSIINNGGYGEEKLAFKSGADLNEEERNSLKVLTEDIDVPKGGGEIQENINRQYYLLLTLEERAEEYDGNSYYTELDKEKIITDLLIERKELKEALKTNFKNFIFSYDNEFKNLENGIYFPDKIQGIKSNLLIINKKGYSGYEIKNNKIVFYPGNEGKDLEGFRNFDFNSEIINLDLEKTKTVNTMGLEISDLNSWKSLDVSGGNN